MFLHIAPDTWEIDLRWNTDSAKDIRVTDTGELQELGCLEGAM